MLMQWEKKLSVFFLPFNFQGKEYAVYSTSMQMADSAKQKPQYSAQWVRADGEKPCVLYHNYSRMYWSARIRKTHAFPCLGRANPGLLRVHVWVVRNSVLVPGVKSVARIHGGSYSSQVYKVSIKSFTKSVWVSGARRLLFGEEEFQ